MCKFCECLIDNTKDILLSSRSRLSIDNTCEIIADDDCSNCKDGCNEYFKLGGSVSNDNVSIQVCFHKEVKDIIIAPFSELLHINYCPFCGEQISKDIKDFNDLYNHIIDVYNKDGSSYDWEMNEFLKSLDIL